jgi:predicted PurR-regulated permease PerM
MIRALIRALIVLGLAYFLYRVRAILPPFIIAAFISFILEPLVALFQDRGIPRSRSILTVYAIVLVTFLIIVTAFVPRLVRDVRRLALEIPKLIEAVQDYAARIQEITVAYNLPPGVTRSIVSLLRDIEDALLRFGDNLLGYFASSATFLSYVVISPVIAYYILRDLNKWRQRGLVFAARYPLPYVDLFRNIDRVVSGFVRGQSIVAFSVFAMVWAAATLLGLGYGAGLGIISGIGEFIPYLGAILGSVPFLLAAFAKSPKTFIWGLAIILAIQWVDSNLIVPNVTGPRVGLHPLWIIFSLLAGAELFGFWGAVVAVPAAGVVGALVEFFGAMASSKAPETG